MVVMRCIILILGLLSVVELAVARGLDFSTKTNDFGVIEEMGGDVSCTFSFRNGSSSPVVIHNIRTSCGCTQPKYSTRPIGVGEESQIEVTFDPRYRPGIFLKDIYVYSTASKDPYVLQIKGQVTPRVLSMEERYPYTLGDGGRIGQLYLSVVGVTEGELSQSVVEYTNTSKRAIEVEFRPRTPRDEFVVFYNEGLAPDEKSVLEFGYFVESGVVDDEQLRDTVDIYVNGKRSDKTLYIKGVARK